MGQADQQKRARTVPQELAYNGLKIELYHWQERGAKAYWEQVVTCEDGYILSDVNEHRLRSEALKEAKEIVDEYLADPSLYRDDWPSRAESGDEADFGQLASAAGL
jgi:hypothetical protein